MMTTPAAFVRALNEATLHRRALYRVILDEAVRRAIPIGRRRSVLNGLTLPYLDPRAVYGTVPLIRTEFRRLCQERGIVVSSPH